MQLIDFRDTCVISRGGRKDEWDNIINPEIIYEGACLYQEGTITYSQSITMRNPSVFLPEVNMGVTINDSIVVTTEYGREIRGVIESARDINMPLLANIRATKIELKQAQGDYL